MDIRVPVGQLEEQVLEGITPSEDDIGFVIATLWVGDRSRILTGSSVDGCMTLTSSHLPEDSGYWQTPYAALREVLLDCAPMLA